MTTDNFGKLSISGEKFYVLVGFLSNILLLAASLHFIHHFDSEAFRLSQSEIFRPTTIGTVALVSGCIYLMKWRKYIDSGTAAMLVFGFGVPLFVISVFWAVGVPVGTTTPDSERFLQYHQFSIAILAVIALLASIWHLRAVGVDI